MYSDRWSPTLRQGDIIGPILLPLVGNKQEAISVMGSIRDEVGGTPKQMILDASHRLVAVVSHDCEFNEGKRDRILVARVKEVPRDLSDDALAAMRLSNDVEARHAADEAVDGVDNFLLDPCPDVYESPHVVVFTTITPYPIKMVDQLHAAKRAELRHDQRLLFRRKLAWFFLRNPEDVPDATKRSPAEILGRLHGT